jgi:dolichol-phosphate mannosyltransferase
MDNKEQLTIILPTFNEKKNVAPILTEIKKVMSDKGISYEIFFVDDSSDDTPAEIEKEIKNNPEIKIRMIHRPKEEHTGLATAFIKGFEEAAGEYICCMDSDLQHPPAVIPELFKKAKADGADIVVATRYAKGGSAEGLGKLTSFYGIYRRAVSLGLKYFTQILFIPTRETSDPLGGFFLFRKKILDGTEFYPKGFKILVEVLMRTKHGKVSEIPYKFLARENETSKATLNQGMEFLRHLWHIFKTIPEAARFLKFCIVGGSGVLVNLSVLALLVELYGFGKNISWLIAVVISILSNYYLNTIFTYGDKRSPNREESLRRILYYYVVSFFSMGVNFIFYHWTMISGLHYLLAAFVGILAATVVNFILVTKLVWKLKIRINGKER